MSRRLVPHSRRVPLYTLATIRRPPLSLFFSLTELRLVAPYPHLHISYSAGKMARLHCRGRPGLLQRIRQPRTLDSDFSEGAGQAKSSRASGVIVAGMNVLPDATHAYCTVRTPYAMHLASHSRRMQLCAWSYCTRPVFLLLRRAKGASSLPRSAKAP
jgi:hypothetical protein